VPDLPPPTPPALVAGEPRCGLSLPVLAPPPNPETTSLPPSSFLALDAVPEAARPAVEHMLREPGSVGLAAYELGQEGEGVYLNPDLPLPLASVVKLIHLIAYAEAVQNGELDPGQAVTLDELERFYLANSDLSAHPNAVAALRAEGRVFGDPASVLLADVPRMMMQYSSNAATDYLHVLLGQERLEATIAALGMTSHTAPCPFLGQFLLMSEGEAAVADYLDDPERYATEVMAATLAFSSEDAATPRGWRGPSRRPESARKKSTASSLTPTEAHVTTRRSWARSPITSSARGNRTFAFAAIWSGRQPSPPTNRLSPGLATRGAPYRAY
jgi:hypothetical protein